MRKLALTLHEDARRWSNDGLQVTAAALPRTSQRAAAANNAPSSDLLVPAASLTARPRRLPFLRLSAPAAQFKQLAVCFASAARVFVCPASAAEANGHLVTELAHRHNPFDKFGMLR